MASVSLKHQETVVLEVAEKVEVEVETEAMAQVLVKTPGLCVVLACG